MVNQAKIKSNGDFSFCRRLCNLQSEECEVIQKRINERQSLVVDFYRDDVFLFQGVFDVLRNSVHLRWVAGDFLPNLKLVDAFGVGFARFLSKDYVSVIAPRRAAFRMLEKLGFNRSHDFPQEFVKGV